MYSSKLIFRIPGQTSWCGFSDIEKKHPRPETKLQIKDISICRNKSSHGYGEKVGILPFADVKMKYSLIDI